MGFVLDLGPGPLLVLPIEFQRRIVDDGLLGPRER
jgi:hypothetical protein